VDGVAFIRKALIANLTGEPLPSLVNLDGTVDPKYMTQRDNELRALKETNKILKKDRKSKANGVRPFTGVPGKQEGGGPKAPARQPEPNDKTREPRPEAKEHEPKPRPEAKEQKPEQKPKAKGQTPKAKPEAKEQIPEQESKAKGQEPKGHKPKSPDGRAGPSAPGKKPRKHNPNASHAGKKPKRSRHKAGPAAKNRGKPRPNPKAAVRQPEGTRPATAPHKGGRGRIASDHPSHGTSPPPKMAPETPLKAPAAPIPEFPPSWGSTRQSQASGALKSNREACPDGPYSFPGSPNPGPKGHGPAARREAKPRGGSGARRGGPGSKAGASPPGKARLARPGKKVLQAKGNLRP
jgi:hypothetical protein